MYQSYQKNSISQKKKLVLFAGIDLGLKDFLLLLMVLNSKITNTQNNKKKRVSESKKTSFCKGKKVVIRFERQRRKTARLHEKITNSRMDNLHTGISPISIRLRYNCIRRFECKRDG